MALAQAPCAIRPSGPVSSTEPVGHLLAWLRDAEAVNPAEVVEPVRCSGEHGLGMPPAAIRCAPPESLRDAGGQ
jgi:hypothetical protein